MLFRNTVAQSAARITGYAFSLLLAPLMLSRLSLAEFGVWAVTGAMATYAGLADMGITRSLSRFIALFETRGDERGIAESIGLGMLAVTLIGSLSAIAAALAAPLFSGAFGVLDTADMRIVLLSSSAIFTAQAYRKVFASLPTGMRRMLPPNIASIFASTVNFAFSVTALLVSPNLVSYALANLAAELIGMVAMLVSALYVKRRLPLAMPTRARTRELLGFGLKNQAIFAADLFNVQANKVILAFLIDVRVAGAYDIGARVASAVKSMAQLTTSAMLPTATADIAARGRTAIRPFYRRYLLRTTAIAFPVFVATAVSAPFLFGAWLGDDVPMDASSVMILLLATHFFNITTGVGTTVAIAEGRPGLAATNSVVAAGFNLVLTLALAPLFGMWGVLAATFLSIAASSLLFIQRLHRAYEMPIGDYLRGVLPPAALSIGLAAPFGVVSFVAAELAAERVPALLALAGTAGIYSFAYWLIASRLDYLPSKLTARWPRRRASQPAA